MRQKKWKQLILSVILGHSFGSAVAVTPYHFVVSLTGGAAMNSNAGQEKNFPATREIFSFYNYQPQHVTQTTSLWGLFVATEFSLHPQWLLQTGLSYYHPGELNVRGTVTQGVQPSLDQYDYSYSIQSSQLLAEGKLLYNFRNLYPYLSAGIGSAFNTSKNFNVNIQPPFTTFSNQFGKHRMTSFTYTVGLGVDMNIGEKWRLGVGYRFADLGKSATSNSTINTTSTTNSLTQSHLYLNEGLVQLTLLI